MPSFKNDFKSGYTLIALKNSLKEVRLKLLSCLLIPLVSLGLGETK